MTKSFPSPSILYALIVAIIDYYNYSLTFKTPNCSLPLLSAKLHVFAVLLGIEGSTSVSEGSPTDAIVVGKLK